VKRPLPEKICASCGRPFTWRRKWARDWSEVRYCSRRCRQERKVLHQELKTELKDCER